MRLPACFGELGLAVALRISLALLVRPLGMTAGAADARREERRGAIVGTDRHTAAMTQLVGALPQPVGHGHTLIEDEALSLPAALLERHLLQIGKDASLEEKYFLNTLALQ